MKFEIKFFIKGNPKITDTLNLRYSTGSNVITSRDGRASFCTIYETWKVFSSFNSKRFKWDQATIRSIASCMSLSSSLVSMNLYSFVSSANNEINVFVWPIASGISLVSMRKSVGPQIDPWGTEVSAINDSSPTIPSAINWYRIVVINDMIVK